MTLYATLFRRAYYRFRKMAFTRSRPDGPFLAVDATAEEVREALGKRCYAPNWSVSYNFKGEVINLARVLYDSSEPKGIRWWQVHIRGWFGGDGLLYLRAHYEPEPTQHPAEHLDGVGYSTDNAMESMRRTLEAGNIKIIKEVEEKNDF